MAIYCEIGLSRVPLNLINKHKTKNCLNLYGNLNSIDYVKLTYGMRQRNGHKLYE